MVYNHILKYIIKARFRNNTCLSVKAKYLRNNLNITMFVRIGYDKADLLRNKPNTEHSNMFINMAYRHLNLIVT